MNGIGLYLTILFSLLVAVGPCSVALASLGFGVAYLSQGVNIEIGVNFTAVRILLLVALVRVISRGELRPLKFGQLDKILILYAVAIAVIGCIRVGTSEALVYHVGGLYNIILGYFVCRALIRSENSLKSALHIWAFGLIPLVLLMGSEASSGRNPFSILGGIPEYSLFRDGHVRAQGAFRSPITAGSFGVTLAMLYIAQIFSKQARWLDWVGLCVACAIAYLAHSSGPLLGLGFGLLALALWRYRAYTSAIRKGMVISLIGLHLVMKAPVWFLIGRVSDIVGGGGYHRAYLIDRFIELFSRWWLMGTSDTSDWMPNQLEIGGADLTNQFVSDGVNAGIIGLILSICLFVVAFRLVGKSLRESEGVDVNQLRRNWAIGSTLTGTVAILFSVTYFDQMHVIWYMLLACVAALSDWNSDAKLRAATRTPS